MNSSPPEQPERDQSSLLQSSFNWSNSGLKIVFVLLALAAVGLVASLEWNKSRGAPEAVSLASTTAGASDSQTFPSVHVSGEVFIVTRAGANIRLGRVPIFAYDRLALAKAIATKKVAADEEQVKHTAEMSDALRRVREAKGEDEKAAAINKLSDLQSKAGQFPSREFFVSELPAPVGMTKTDSDGRFQFDVQPQSVTGIALVASAERLAGDTAEKYLWVVAANRNAKGIAEVTLSNDNTTDTQASESLLFAK